MSTDGPYKITNPAFPYLPENVDADKCASTTSGPHKCVHDWRIHWGNVPKTEEDAG